MTSTHTRVNYNAFRKLAPDAGAALSALGKAVDDAGFDKELTELIKIRVSQINGCAFCLQHHLNIARKLGVKPEKIDLVAVWRDAGIFTERECTALAWSECLTNLATAGAPDDAYAAVRAHFTEAEAVFLTIAIGTINTWNRIGVALRFAPPMAPG